MYGEHGGIEVILSTHRWQQPTFSEAPMVNCTFPGPPRIHVIPSARIRAPRPTGVGREPGRCIRVPILNPQCPGNCEKGGRHRWLKSRDLGNSSQFKKKKKKSIKDKGEGGSEAGKGAALILGVRPFYSPRHPGPGKYGRGGERGSVRVSPCFRKS